MDYNSKRQELLVKMFQEATDTTYSRKQDFLPLCMESLRITFEENNNDLTKIDPVLVNVAQELKKLSDGGYNSRAKQGIAVRKGLRKNLFKDVNIPD